MCKVTYMILQGLVGGKHTLALQTLQLQHTASDVVDNFYFLIKVEVVSDLLEVKVVVNLHVAEQTCRNLCSGEGAEEASGGVNADFQPVSPCWLLKLHSLPTILTQTFCVTLFIQIPFGFLPRHSWPQVVPEVKFVINFVFGVEASVLLLPHVFPQHLVCLKDFLTTQTLQISQFFMKNIQELSSKHYVIRIAEGKAVLVGQVLEAVGNASANCLAAVDALP